MKQLVFILSLFIIVTSCKGNEKKEDEKKSTKQENKLKRYNVKSGIVHYTTKISGKVMGSDISGSGTRSTYFKDWGALELTEEKSTQTTKINILGIKKTETSNTHTIAKLDNGESYHVDFDKKQILLLRDPLMDMHKMGDRDVAKTGKAMLEAMGGKLIGNDSYLGYDCEIWEIMGGKQWLYKGIMLKLEITVMGITTITEASSAKFNVSVANKHFKLPNFPIVKEEGFMDNEEMEDEMEDMDKSMEKLGKMSFKEWKKLAKQNDEEMRNKSDEELRQTYDMMQQMIKMRKGR